MNSGVSQCIVYHLRCAGTLYNVTSDSADTIQYLFDVAIICKVLAGAAIMPCYLCNKRNIFLLFIKTVNCLLDIEHCDNALLYFAMYCRDSLR